MIAVSTRRTSSDEKRRLVELLLALSVRGSIGPRRPIELDVLVRSEIRPWRYPPPFDFHFDELLRKEFESGDLEPWPAPTHQDIASAITMALLGETALFGPPPANIGRSSNAR